MFLRENYSVKLAE